jgi:hypothetical protein
MSSPEPNVTVAFEGETYTATLNLPAMAAAESFFRAKGHELDLWQAAEAVTRYDYAATLRVLRELLPCMLHSTHPGLEYLEVQQMIDRSLATGNLALVNVARLVFRDPEGEQAAANANLTFDPESLVQAEEFFAGQAGLSALTFGEGLSVLNRTCRIFPCAVHRFRPELSVVEAQALMTWKSVGLVVDGFWQMEQRTPYEQIQAFAARLMPFAPAAELEDCAFRVIAKELAPGAAQA